MSEFLLEIGSGELPYAEVRDIPAAFSDRFRSFFEKNLSLPEEPVIHSFSTPKRVVVTVQQIPLKTLDREIETVGPPLNISYQGDSPALPLVRFMEKNGIADKKKLYVIHQKRGDYIAYKKVIKGRLLKDLLSENIPNIIKSIPFKKSMFWTNKDIRYSRPILWILSLFDGKPLKFSYGDIEAGGCTYLAERGARKMSGVKVNNPKDYFELISLNGIILKNSDRRAFIEKELGAAAEKLKLDIAGYEDDFIDEIVGLTETPHAIAGSFDKKFMSVPEELLSMVMRKHQRFFPLQKGDNLMPHFIGIANIMPDNLKADKEEIEHTVGSGYSRVLAARLADADFFYKEDIKHPLAYFIEKTKDILFYEGLGSYFDKMKRVDRIGSFIIKEYGFSEKDATQFVRAASLLKFDLATHIVYEFSEMQGVAGRIYAKRAGESEAVYSAIEEHYYPVSKAGKKIMPSNNISALCSLSDKIDTIFSFVMIKRLPTGESDPFYLRRAMIGIIEIVIDRKYIIHMEQIFDFYFSKFFNSRNLDLNELKRLFAAFANTRFKYLLMSLGYKPDEITSVANEGITYDFYTSYLKIDFVSKHRSLKEFCELSQAYKRIKNITSNYGDILSFDTNKLILPDEIRLLEAFETVRGESGSFLGKNDYVKAVNGFYTLIKPINDFFDNVLILTDDEGVKNSRLGLLNNILNLFKKICDFSNLSC